MCPYLQYVLAWYVPPGGVTGRWRAKAGLSIWDLCDLEGMLVPVSYISQLKLLSSRHSGGNDWQDNEIASATKRIWPGQSLCVSSLNPFRTPLWTPRNLNRWFESKPRLSRQSGMRWKRRALLSVNWRGSVASSLGASWTWRRCEPNWMKAKIMNDNSLCY